MKALYIEHEIKIGTYDIDFAGHVSNIVYLRWLEDMRLKMFELHCPLEIFLAQGLTPVLVSTEIKYKKPLRLFDKPKGIMWVSKLGNTSLTIEAEIYVQDKLATTASHVGVFIEVESGRPVRLPLVFREVVASFPEPSSAVL